LAKPLAPSGTNEPALGERNVTVATRFASNLDNMKSIVLVFTVAGLILAAPLPTNAQDKPTAHDNTKVNKRDRQTGAVTADQQKENIGDRELSANIRRALMEDKNLSTYAHNVKIVAEEGIVTLKGPVRSQEEKKAVEAKATEIAGTGKVKSMISVKPKS
jgi:hyperosmotically inducible periplasmic protein